MVLRQRCASERGGGGEDRSAFVGRWVPLSAAGCRNADGERNAVENHHDRRPAVARDPALPPVRVISGSLVEGCFRCQCRNQNLPLLIREGQRDA